MPSGVYTRTEYHTSLNSKGHKGILHIQEWKDKMSERVRGNKHPLWGKSHTEIARQKIREARALQVSPMKGKHFSGKSLENIIQARLKDGIKRRGSKLSIERRRRMSEARRGEKSSFWKGGLVEKNLIIRNSLEYRFWREAVFKRDDWTCVACKIRGGKLNADHIKPFAWFPELRFAIDNGRTLCVECHRKTDTYGGKKRRK